MGLATRLQVVSYPAPLLAAILLQARKIFRACNKMGGGSGAGYETRPRPGD